MSGLVAPNLDPIPLGVLRSAVTNIVHASSERFDPYHMGMTPGALRASWESAALTERLAAVRNNREPAPPRTDLAQRWIRARPDAQSAMAALGMWRTLSTDQAAAFGGWDCDLDNLGRWRHAPPELRRLWDAGFVDRGRIISSQSGLPFLWKPARPHVTNRFLDELSYPEWLRCTGGTEWRASTGGDIHNTLAADLGLRVAEHCDVATVVGETLCRIGVVDPTLPERFHTAGADMCAVRHDGLRIMFEVTVSQSVLGIRRKVERWCDILMERPFDDSALVVCFVEAAPPDVSGKSIEQPLREEILRAIRLRPGGAFSRLRERMLVARWRWWFPSAHHAAAGFSNLLAFRPTGPVDDPWVSVPMLNGDAFEFTPSDPESLGFIVSNSKALAGVPYWLRHTDR